jgi:hypothetical protein
MIEVKHRMRRILGAGVAVAALSILSGSRPAMATPSTLGFYPSTDTYADKSFHLDVDTYGEGLKTNGTNSVGLTYGLGGKDGAFGRSEIGLDYITNAGSLSVGKRLLFNGKTQLYNNDDSKTRVVAGVWGVGSKDVASPDYLYLLGSKAFDWGRIHLGVAQALAKKGVIASPAQAFAGQGGDRTSLHLGYDRAITSKLSFAIDYYSGKNLYAGVQPTLYYAVNDKASFGIGYLRLNDGSVGPSRNQVYAAFDYNFGGPSGQQEAQPVSPATGAPAKP